MASCLLVLCFIISISKFKSGFLLLFISFWVFLEVIYYCFDKYAFECGKLTGLIMIVELLVKMPFYLFTV
jgi:hypothetical protein